MNTKFIYYIILSSLTLSCTKRFQNLDYDSSKLDTLRFQEIEILDSSFFSLLSQFSDKSNVFEHGINQDREKKVSYYTIVNSLCGSDSSIIVLRCTSGHHFFYGFSKELDQRILDQYGLVQNIAGNILITNNFVTKLCLKPERELLRKQMSHRELELKYYVNKQNEPLIEINPYFVEFYYLENGKFIFLDRDFPDPLVKIN